MNTDEGGLSACHPGMRRLLLLAESVRRLHRGSGNRQVRKVDGGLAHPTVTSGDGWPVSVPRGRPHQDGAERPESGSALPESALFITF
ncbi:hypothetical protein ACFVXE_24545 [Streptomyces sp. NPDC058231]|uniref:thiolase C-terminal domain-containing protein n=1 Tax=Streptomyces sp. NPDC058231 TaxID=3346392 RepID=UPI0036E4A21E